MHPSKRVARGQLESYMRRGQQELEEAEMIRRQAEKAALQALGDPSERLIFAARYVLYGSLDRSLLVWARSVLSDVVPEVWPDGAESVEFNYPSSTSGREWLGPWDTTQVARWFARRANELGVQKEDLWVPSRRFSSRHRKTLGWNLQGCGGSRGWYKDSEMWNDVAITAEGDHHGGNIHGNGLIEMANRIEAASRSPAHIPHTLR